MLSLHAIGAAALRLPELEIDQAESHALVDAIQGVQKQYPQWDVSEKILCWVHLGGVAAFVYGPRIATYKLRTSRETPKQSAPMVQ